MYNMLRPGNQGPGVSNQFLCEHLATFVISNGVSMSAEDGIDRLRKIETSGGVWTMKVILNVSPSHVVAIDDTTKEDIEKFPLSSVRGVQSVKVDNIGAYNNLIIFSVSDEIPELHIFHCIGRSANEFVEVVKSFKNGRVSPIVTRVKGVDVGILETVGNGKSNNVRELLRQSMRYRPGDMYPGDANSITTTTDKYVKLLDCSFSDIEFFVNHLQQAVEAYENLRKRRTIRGEGNGDGLLRMKSKLPSGKDITDILQKFKLSFILIEKLNKVISNPNAPELIHFLFKPLIFVVKVTAGQDLEKLELVSRVDNPLINIHIRAMFENCLDSSENDFWRKLGPAWSSTSVEWKEELPTYQPVFQDGWAAPLDWMKELFRESQGPPVNAISHGPPTSEITQEEFLRELQKRNAKIAIAKESRDAANKKELSVDEGDVLEVKNDDRNWWKVRNYKRETGFVPKRILQLA